MNKRKDMPWIRCNRMASQAGIIFLLAVAIFFLYSFPESRAKEVRNEEIDITGIAYFTALENLHFENIVIVTQ